MSGDNVNSGGRPRRCLCSVSETLLLCNIDAKRTWDKKGKDHFSCSALLLAESRASCQGTTFHFSDMRLRQERGGRGGGEGWVRASAGPPGTPLPGGGKSMWFLSYLWAGESTASNAHSQWAAKREKDWRWKRFDSSPTAILIYSWSLCRWTCVCVCVCVCKCRWTHTHTHSTVATGEVTSAAQSRVSHCKGVKLGKCCFPLNFNCSPITSRDTPPHMVKTNTAAQTCTPNTQERQRGGDFHGNVIRIISTSMVQVIRCKG